MARYEIWNVDSVPMGGAADGDTLFQLGMRYAATAATADERVAAHKWLNIAAMRGNAEAARLRREIAAEMSAAEIATAQRAARDWVTRR
jgi:TPR repeat protein